KSRTFAPVPIAAEMHASGEFGSGTRISTAELGMVEVPNQAICSMTNSDEWVILESAPTVHYPIGFDAYQKKCLTCGVTMPVKTVFVKHWNDSHLESTFIKIRGQPDQ
ncbi:hypothetical protein IW150_005695, partial [Coemansia sp. RSA 2607]